MEIDRLVQQGNPVQVVMAQPEQVEALCGSFPSYLPKDKQARIVTVAGNLGCPCSGCTQSFSILNGLSLH